MQKKEELSLLNVVFCILVILIHVLSSPVTNLSKDSVAWTLTFFPWRLSAFVVQGFIFLSGTKMFLFSKSVSYVKYYLRRFEKIVVPYIFFVLLFYLYFLKIDWLEFNLKELLGYIVKGDLVSHFYFVVVIVQFYLLRPVWEFMIKRVNPIAAIAVSAVVTVVMPALFGGFEYRDRVFSTYILYWVLGCYAGKYYDITVKAVKKYKYLLFSGFAVALVCEAVLSYLHFSGKAALPMLEYLHMLYCVLAIGMLFAAANYVSLRTMKYKLLKKIDSASYYIYLIHPLFLFVFRDREFSVRTVLTYVCSIAACIFYVDIKALQRK